MQTTVLKQLGVFQILQVDITRRGIPIHTLGYAVLTQGSSLSSTWKHRRLESAFAELRRIVGQNQI